jgi:hypothetical protein
MSATLYANVFPLSQKSEYYSQENVDFLLNLDNVKLVPGSVVIEGEVAVFPDRSDTATAYNGQDIMYDAQAGFHGLFRDITTEFQNVGVIENFMNYSRYVKMATVALTHDESLAVESVNCVEGKVMNAGQTRGMLYGRSTTDSYIPFSVKPLICLNKANAPMSGASTGQIRIRARLAPDEEFLYGTGYTQGTTGYIIKNLRVRYIVVPDDGKKSQVQMEVYQTFRSSVDSNNQNISTFIPGLCDSVHISFIPQVSEGTPQKNYLQLAVPPGQPPLGASGTYTGGHYGIERLYYSVADTDTAVVGFTLESREEIVHNALRSFKTSADKYGSLIRHYNKEDASDSYIVGIPFGGLIDFSRVKFSMEVQSLCSNDASLTSGVHICYIYARCLSTVEA